MSDKDKKRVRNDQRREHVDRVTGEKHKHRILQEKINEADKAMKDYQRNPDFCTTMEEHPFADE